MASRRSEIRQRVAELLKGKTLAGDRVFSNRASATWSEELPIIAVYTRGEIVEDQNTAPREYKRTIDLVIEVVAEGPEVDPTNPNPSDKTPAEDVLDEICDSVEKELGRDDRLGETLNLLGERVALVDQTVLQGILFDFQSEGVRPQGSAIMTFNVIYKEFVPGSLDEQDGIGVFKTAHADWSVGHDNSGPDAIVEATDEITIPD